MADEEEAEANRRGAKRAGRDSPPVRPAPEGGEAKRLFGCRRFD